MVPVKFIPYGRVRYKAKEHPLYSTWRNIRSQHPCVEIWKEFRKFCADVGLRPYKSDLRRISNEQPFGPNNWYWKKRVGV